MEGYLITFFTQQNREHESTPLADWIVEEAKRAGVRGATLFSGKEGFGHDGRFHSGNYFDFDDPPQLITMALTEEECDLLFPRLQKCSQHIFYTKSKAEFGFIS
ncbi:DUF190 domain-containing protein [Maridesulfovibrio sp.]|jgi:PII-like signaling protein|uniref:DUF190 domain-containing protein n=1 Tax=Maridesulfovibrio sp. TaxID=2795000 RepID=UPI0029C9CA51|nr:DUF190 domain-containing protein [Maridesulfovibrio sp.]